jgi:hypothetical protein
MSRSILFVLTDHEDGAEEAFNDWYDKQHLQEVLEIPGFVGAQRYRAASVSGFPEGSQVPNRYLATYEIEGDPQVAADGLLERRNSGTIVVPSFVLASRRMRLYEELGARVTA